VRARARTEFFCSPTESVRRDDFATVAFFAGEPVDYVNASTSYSHRLILVLKGTDEDNGLSASKNVGSHFEGVI